MTSAHGRTLTKRYTEYNNTNTQCADALGYTDVYRENSKIWNVHVIDMTTIMEIVFSVPVSTMHPFIRLFMRAL